MLLREKRHPMSNVLHPIFQVMIALACLATLIWPRIVGSESENDASNPDRL
jgi:hypothetical protein